MSENHEKRIDNLELNLAKITGDITHIKDKIDNHICSTLAGISKSINEAMPLVKENSYWVAVWKKAVVWTAVIGVGGGIITTAFFLLRTFLAK